MFVGSGDHRVREKNMKMLVCEGSRKMGEVFFGEGEGALKEIG